HRWILCDIWLGGNKTTSFSVEKVKFVNERQGRDQPDIPVTHFFQDKLRASHGKKLPILNNNDYYLVYCQQIPDSPMHTLTPVSDQAQADTKESPQVVPEPPQSPLPAESHQKCAPACRGCGRHRHHPT
ncbi:hypothetical protein, partial [Ectothiorhodospira shaposhnikovii]|uniref:hypothetical protein n=1 Tax=Ectothiorhodospira shaposhnikovii TaxID=1054 RepID=UPI001A92E73F